MSSCNLGSASTTSKISHADESMSMDMYSDAILAMSRRVVIELERERERFVFSITKIRQLFIFYVIFFASVTYLQV